MQVSVSEAVPMALGEGGTSSQAINSHFLPSARRSACPRGEDGAALDRDLTQGHLTRGAEM